jgi:N-formylglutamate deformylase
MMDITKSCSIIEGDGPVVATAVHDGHLVSPGAVGQMALSESERLREEDPFTFNWVKFADTQIVGLHSRFEVDLNRPREKAIYLKPEDCWGLKLWKDQPSQNVVTEAYRLYDSFYQELKRILTRIERKFGYFIVYDMHCYNHRRNGYAGPDADPQLNPEVNIGTGSDEERATWLVDRSHFEPLIKRVMDDMQRFDYFGRDLDVRENVKFKGGYFSTWIRKNFPQTGCVLSVEFKKFWMDEISGQPYNDQIAMLCKVLESTLPGVRQELSKLSIQ